MSDDTLAELIHGSAEHLKIELGKIRAAAKHKTNKGTSAEAAVAQFLRAQLPASMGVTTGEVVDSLGNRSKQEDVIIYDATRTPALFSSADGQISVLPAEGVLAVIEVKMHLTAGHPKTIVEHCTAATSLARTAYYGSPEVRFQAFGAQWSELPIYYSVFAFESDNFYASQFNELQAGLPLHQRVASVCYLDRGASMYLTMQSTEAGFVTRPEPPGIMVDIENPENALLVWFTSLCDTIFQASSRPIALTNYATSRLSDLRGTVGQQTPQARRELIVTLAQHIVTQDGGPDGIAAKIMADEPVTGEEKSALHRVGWTVVDGPDGMQTLMSLSRTPGRPVGG